MSFTSSSTFTRTNARYIAGKIAADLKQMQLFYDRPADSEIDGYVEEATELLAGGYLKVVEYGFRKGGDWILSLRYEVHHGVLTDGGSGGVYAFATVEPSSFHSFLTYSNAFFELTASQREAVKDNLPIKRSSGSELGHIDGYFETGNSYASGGVGAQRSTWRPR